MAFQQFLLAAVGLNPDTLCRVYVPSKKSSIDAGALSCAKVVMTTVREARTFCALAMESDPRLIERVTFYPQRAVA